MRRLAAMNTTRSDVGAVNSFESPRVVDVVERRVEVGGGRFEYRFPAHSVSVLRFEVDGR
jgi:alpha-L-arabinofuranosidase